MEKDYLVKKWLANELTDQEQQAFDQLPDAAFYKEIREESLRFKASQQFKAPAFNTIVDRLDTSTAKKPANYVKPFLRIAAVLVLSISILFYTLRDTSEAITTDLAQKQQISLPDNSTVTVNENSKLTYDPKTWDDNRTIALEGEAFFDVENGQTFEVVTPNGTVQVLGTEFNVKSRDRSIEVICYEGKVRVSKGNKEVILTPGKGVAINDVILDLNTTVTQPQWTEEMSVFKRASIAAVFKELSKQYDISINTSTIDGTLLFTGAFQYNNLENALKAITTPLNLAYTIEGNQVTIRSLNE